MQCWQRLHRSIDNTVDYNRSTGMEDWIWDKVVETRMCISNSVGLVGGALHQFILRTWKKCMITEDGFSGWNNKWSWNNKWYY